MRKSLRRLAALAVVGALLLSPSAMTVLQADAGMGHAYARGRVSPPSPALAYYWLNADNDCRPTRQNPCGRERYASVEYDVHYRLQDGTWIGHDRGGWDGPVSSGPSSGAIGAALGEGVTIGGGAVGGIVGKALSDRIKASMAAGSRLAPVTNVAVFTATVSPWVGALVGAMAGAA